jgi:hypothetical protein
LIILVMFGVEYKLWSSSLCSFFQSHYPYCFKKTRTLRVCLYSATSILMKERTGIEIDLDPNPCVSSSASSVLGQVVCYSFTPSF